MKEPGEADTESQEDGERKREMEQQKKTCFNWQVAE